MVDFGRGGRRARRGWVVAALSWLAASCSSGVDGYRFESRDSSITATGGATTGGDGATGGIVTTGGTGGASAGTGGTGGSSATAFDTGGTGAAAGSGGATATGGTTSTGGTTATGGAATGGTAGSGGTNSGGTTSSGGTTATGGATSTGGKAATGGATATGGTTSTGGTTATGGTTSTGGTTTTGGTTSTGGTTATGGTTSTGGTTATGGPPTPVSVSLSGVAVGNVTAAAWNGTSFFLLDATDRLFYPLDPTNGVVATGLPLPSGTVEPKCFGATATSVFVVANGGVYELPATTGFVNQTPASPTISHPTGALSGAYANGFLIGNDTSGASASALFTGQSTVQTESTLKAIYGVASDGISFVFRTVSGTTTLIHRASLPSPTIGAGCAMTPPGDQSGPTAVFGNNVAWVVSPGANNLLYFSTIDGSDACATPTFGTSLGAATSGSKAVGLIDDATALAVTSTAPGMVTVESVSKIGNATSPTLNVNSLGNGVAKSFVMAYRSGDPAQRAVLVSNDIPALLSF